MAKLELSLYALLATSESLLISIQHSSNSAIDRAYIFSDNSVASA